MDVNSRIGPDCDPLATVIEGMLMHGVMAKNRIGPNKLSALLSVIAAASK
jgi:hypothetical protein